MPKKYIFVPRLAIFVLLLAFCGFVLPTFAQNTPIPARSERLVNDYAGVMNADEQAQLEAKLTAFSDSTSNQVSIVIEKTLDGADPFDRSLAIARAWGIGKKDKGNGILLYVAVAEHKVRIQTGYGSEGFLTDALSRRIIEEKIKPNFKAGKYYAGLDAATTAIIERNNGEFKAENVDPTNKNDGGANFFVVILFLIIGIIVIGFIVRRFNRNISSTGGIRSGNRVGNSLPPFWMFPFDGGGNSGGGWGGGGGGNDSSSGGFGGFGGGDFGGGGAGGDW